MQEIEDTRFTDVDHNYLVVTKFLYIPFQCYSLATIGYRVATFNDCVEASESLQQVSSVNFVPFWT